jgi:hypothetical protein
VFPLFVDLKIPKPDVPTRRVPYLSIKTLDGDVIT